MKNQKAYSAHLLFWRLAASIVSHLVSSLGTISTLLGADSTLFSALTLLFRRGHSSLSMRQLYSFDAPSLLFRLYLYKHSLF